MRLKSTVSQTTACHPMEERGGVSRAHSHLKWHAIKLAVDSAVFDRVKTVLFYTTIEKF